MKTVTWTNEFTRLGIRFTIREIQDTYLPIDPQERAENPDIWEGIEDPPEHLIGTDFWYFEVMARFGIGMNGKVAHIRSNPYTPSMADMDKPMRMQVMHTINLLVDGLIKNGLDAMECSE